MKKTVMRSYAKLIVRVGANVQKGQEVRVFASLDQPEFIKMLAEECYKAGASRVTVDWNYPELTKLSRALHGSCATYPRPASGKRRVCRIWWTICRCASSSSPKIRTDCAASTRSISRHLPRGSKSPSPTATPSTTSTSGASPPCRVRRGRRRSTPSSASAPPWSSSGRTFSTPPAPTARTPSPTGKSTTAISRRAANI